MALYHKWGVKTGFTFSHQFFMLLYDSLGGVSMHYKICIFLLFFVEKCKVDFITFLTTLCQWGIGDFHRKLHVWHVKKPTWMLFQHGAVQWSVLSFQLKALEILPEKNPNPKNKWQKSQHFHLKWMSLVVDLPNRDHSGIALAYFDILKAHPLTYVSINSTVNHQKLPFSDPTHPPLSWRNTWMVP